MTSGANYSEVGQTSHVRDSLPRAALTQTTAACPTHPGPHLCPAGYKFRSSHKHLKSVIHWNDSTQLWKVLHSQLQFYYSKRRQIRTNQKEGHIKWSLRGSKCKVSDLLPMESQIVLGPLSFHVQQRFRV